MIISNSQVGTGRDLKEETLNVSKLRADILVPNRERICIRYGPIFVMGTMDFPKEELNWIHLCFS